MSLKPICISWMRHISIMFLMCRMSYFIIKYFCWVLCCAIKNQENILFSLYFHLVYKNAWFPKFHFTSPFYHFSCRRKKTHFQLNQRFYYLPGVFFVLFLISLHPVCFWMTGSFPTWLGVKGNCFCPMGPESLIWNEPVICLLCVTRIQESFMARFIGCVSLGRVALVGNSTFCP